MTDLMVAIKKRDTEKCLELLKTPENCLLSATVPEDMDSLELETMFCDHQYDNALAVAIRNNIDKKVIYEILKNKDKFDLFALDGAGYDCLFNSVGNFDEELTLKILEVANQNELLMINYTYCNPFADMITLNMTKAVKYALENSDKFPNQFLFDNNDDKINAFETLAINNLEKEFIQLFKIYSKRGFPYCDINTSVLFTACNRQLYKAVDFILDKLGKIDLKKGKNAKAKDILLYNDATELYHKLDEITETSKSKNKATKIIDMFNRDIIKKLKDRDPNTCLVCDGKFNLEVIYNHCCHSFNICNKCFYSVEKDVCFVCGEDKNDLQKMFKN